MRIAEEYCAHLTDSGTTPLVLCTGRKFPSTDDSMNAVSSLQELQVALTALNLASSHIPDGVTCYTLNHLSTKAQERLLVFINTS